MLSSEMMSRLLIYYSRPNTAILFLQYNHHGLDKKLIKKRVNKSGKEATI